MESVQFQAVSMLCPNPTPKRATRTRWDFSNVGKISGGKNMLAYGVNKFLVLRNLDDPL